MADGSAADITAKYITVYPKKVVTITVFDIGQQELMSSTTKKKLIFKFVRESLKEFAVIFFNTQTTR